jgi:uncharacterized protein YggE
MHFVRASGDATVQAKPDRVQVAIGVSTQAPTAQAAGSRNALQTSNVLESLKGVVGERGEVKTIGYSLTPQYVYAPNQPPRLTHYEASNTVFVTLDDLSQTGKLIDTATASGANNIGSISFTVRDSSAMYAQALAQAATKARANAEAVARALNLRVLGLLSAEPQESSPIRPIPMNRMAARSADAATPVEAGDVDIHAGVIVTLEVQ